MSTPDHHKAAIKSAIATLQQRNSFSRQFKAKILKHQRETSKAGAGYREQIFEKIYKSAGIDPSDILRRQEFEDSSAKKFLDSLMPEVIENSKTIKERHAARFKLMQRKHLPLPPPQEPIRVTLPHASDITFDPVPALANVITTAGLIADGDNLIRIKVSGDTEHSHSNNDYNCNMFFSWTPPRDGWLDVVTFASVNGSHAWSSQHKCVEAAVQQTASVILYVGNSVDLILGPAEFFIIFDWSKFPGCATDTGMEIVEQFYAMQLSGDSAVQVFANKPVIIVINVNVAIINEDAHSSMDFYTGDQSISVPGVYLTLR